MAVDRNERADAQRPQELPGAGLPMRESNSAMIFRFKQRAAGALFERVVALRGTVILEKLQFLGDEMGKSSKSS